jgi:hypothetical protein
VYQPGNLQTQIADTLIPSRLRNVQTRKGSYSRYLETTFAEKHWLLSWAHKGLKAGEKTSVRLLLNSALRHTNHSRSVSLNLMIPSLSHPLQGQRHKDKSNWGIRVSFYNVLFQYIKGMWKTLVIVLNLQSHWIPEQQSRQFTLNDDITPKQEQSSHGNRIVPSRGKESFKPPCNTRTEIKINQTIEIKTA